MQEENQSLCGQLAGYLVMDLTEVERQSFERHLAGCPSCRQELDELKEVWVAMPLQNEELDVPDDLKGTVMRAIFGEGTSGSSPTLEEAEWRAGRKRGTLRNFAFAAAAAAVLLLAYALWPRAGAVNPGVSQTVLGPAQLVKAYDLKAVDQAMPQAGGNAWVVERDGRNEIVVQLHGLAPTKGDEAYQVWLVHNGNRYNCGTLLINGQGSGVLTYYVKKENLVFEAIGVTLEPDAKGTQPRGLKVLGS